MCYNCFMNPFERQKSGEEIIKDAQRGERMRILTERLKDWDEANQPPAEQLEAIVDELAGLPMEDLGTIINKMNFTPEWQDRLRKRVQERVVEKYGKKV